MLNSVGLYLVEFDPLWNCEWSRKRNHTWCNQSAFTRGTAPHIRTTCFWGVHVASHEPHFSIIPLHESSCNCAEMRYNPPVCGSVEQLCCRWGWSRDIGVGKLHTEPWNEALVRSIFKAVLFLKPWFSKRSPWRIAEGLRFEVSYWVLILTSLLGWALERKWISHSNTRINNSKMTQI